MSKYRLSFVFLLFSCLIATALFIPASAHASGSGTSVTCTDTSASGTNNCDNCISSAYYQSIASGASIISAMFNTINSVLANVEYSFFNGIVGNTTFQQVLGTAVILYVAIYGLMIMFNISSYRVGEVATRLMKIAFIYAILGPGAWGAFNNWIQNPVIGAMNQTIKEFTVVAESGSSPTTVSVPTASGTSFSASGNAVSGTGLDPTAFAAMFGSSMTTVLSAQLFTAIMTMSKTGYFGWLISFFLAFAVYEFIMMMLGALITYAKAIIGLAFLFGVAPLFVCFLLFERTRDIFWIWLSHVLTFALQPVLLFAFLAFYVGIINQAVPHLLTDDSGNQADFCWTNWFSMPGTLLQVYSWQATSSGATTTGAFNDISGNVSPSPINVPNAIYFLMLCHLAKTFTGYIEKLSENIAEGAGPGVTTAGALENTFKEGIGKISNAIKSERKAPAVPRAPTVKR